jgi:hypothetical protein
MALLAELRAHERQAAEELGQWVEPHEEHNGVIWSNSSMLAASARDKRPSEGLARRRKQLRTIEERCGFRGANCRVNRAPLGCSRRREVAAKVAAKGLRSTFSILITAYYDEIFEVPSPLQLRANCHFSLAITVVLSSFQQYSRARKFGKYSIGRARVLAVLAAGCCAASEMLCSSPIEGVHDRRGMFIPRGAP